jgi:hypothetical protein
VRGIDGVREGGREGKTDGWMEEGRERESSIG